MPVEASQLKHLYPLDSMRPEHLEELSKEGDLVELHAGSQLFAANDTDEQTYYLLKGEVKGEYPDGRIKSTTAGGDSLQGRYPIGDLQPRRFTASVVSPVATLVKFDRRFLEKVIAWDQVVRGSNLKHFESSQDGNRWVFRLLQSRALRKLPIGNIERLFVQFEEIQAKNAQVIINEGDDGDFFYVIKDGAAAVSQMIEGSPSIIAYLVRGDSFGEDALLSNNKRNATVTMMKDGKLMRLGKSQFTELLKQPVVEWLTPGKASIWVRQGAGVLDVRTPEEFEDRAIKGALSMPLVKLREVVTQLSKDQKYVVYCNTGERSAAAVFILQKMGFEAAALQGGLSAMIKQAEGKKPA
jgi:CRP-like cAMP-binding protein